MGWNGSGSGKAVEPPKVKKSGGGISPAVVKGAFGGLLVIVAALAVFTFFRGRDDKPAPKTEKRAAPIKEVTLAPAPKADPVTNAVPAKKPFPTYRDERGILRYKGGLRAPDPTRPKGETIKAGVDSKGNPLWKTCIFKNPAEREISRLLTLEPGRPLIGTVLYNQRFEQAYEESLKTPIIITKDDSPEDAALKKAMIDTKIEISDRMRNGEKLADILKEARSELERLAAYRRDIEKMVREESAKEGITETEASDIVEAANKMLKEKGAAPIHNGVMARRNLMIMSQNLKNGVKNK